MIPKKVLEKLYVNEKKSMQETADALGCSLHKVQYWLGKHEILSRSRNEAMYVKYNPTGDPFEFSTPKTLSDSFLFGLGLGLYWGEGTKMDKNAVRLGNSDPALIRSFNNFLHTCYGVKKEELTFALQVFSDINPQKTVDFWSKEIGVHKSQFRKTIITPSRGKGTYSKKLEHGVLTVYFCNTKLRNALVRELETLGLKTRSPM